MKKTDVIRGLKSELKDLINAPAVGNIDYHRGKIDQMKLIIEDFDHIIQGSFKRLPSRELKIIKNTNN